MAARAPSTLGDPPSPRLRRGKPATLGEWLQWAERAYARQGVALGQVATTAHDEALYLLLRTLGLPLDSKPAVLRRKLTAEETDRVEEVFRRRIAGRVPAAYLTHEAFLGGHRFHVDERVIIPRSYFLELLPEQIPHWLPVGKPVKRAVDVCTGSGCLAILLAHQFPVAKVDAIELSPGALAVAKFNVASHHLTKRIKLHHSDVFDALEPVHYDLILSNPPYVPTRELRGLPEEFTKERRWRLMAAATGSMSSARSSGSPASGCSRTASSCWRSAACGPRWSGEFAALDLHWLHTEDGEDCVCVAQAARLAKWRG